MQVRIYRRLGLFYATAGGTVRGPQHLSAQAEGSQISTVASTAWGNHRAFTSCWPSIRPPSAPLLFWPTPFPLERAGKSTHIHTRPFVTVLWSAHCVCTNNAALAKHHQITTRATTQHNMKRNTSFNPQMKRSVSSSYHPVQPWTWLLSTRKHKKREKKTLSLDLTLALRQPWNWHSLHEQRETAWLNIHLYLFAFRVLVTTFISSDRQDAMLNTSSRLWWHNKALTESVHLQLRTKCVSCSSQLVKKKSFSSLQHPFIGLSSLSVVNMLQKDGKLTGSVRYTPTHSPRPAAELKI